MNEFLSRFFYKNDARMIYWGALLSFLVTILFMSTIELLVLGITYLFRSPIPLSDTRIQEMVAAFEVTGFLIVVGIGVEFIGFLGKKIFNFYSQPTK